MIEKVKSAEINLCIVHEDDVDEKPYEPEANHVTDKMVIPQLRNGIFELADAENVFDGNSQCDPANIIRVGIQLTEKSEEWGGNFSLRFIFPKCKQRVGSDLSFKPYYPYDHKPILEAFIDENLEIFKKPCKPEDVYIPGTKENVDETNEDDPEKKSGENENGSQKNETVEDNRSEQPDELRVRRKLIEL